MLAWLGKEQAAVRVQVAPEEAKVYCEDYPDTWGAKREASMKQKLAAKMKGKKGAKEPERYPGIYYDAQTGSWFCLTDKMRRCPVEGRPFYHPYLDRVVNCVRTGLFTELDGSVVAEGCV